MTRSRFLLIPVLWAVVAGPAPAGLLFGKKAPKPNPSDQVNELIGTVKLDKDETKRAAAAEELRHFDPKAYPDIVSILIDVLLNDPKPSVRAEAAQSLGKLRPVTQEAGWALEQAVAKDASMRVRLQARTALLSYQWAGYQSPKTTEGPMLGQPSSGPSKPAPRLPMTPEPPLATPRTSDAARKPLPLGPELIPPP